MRELDTSSPVVWPSWCYTGVADLDLKHRARMNGTSPTSGSTAIDILNNNSTSTNNNSTSTTGASTNSGSVKAERFSPPTGDNNSSSSRSGTPVSSYEGVGGERSSPMALSLSQARERDPLKAMEQATSRNYSDFMRSLAAKYNHTNPNEHNVFSYFSGTGVPTAVTVPNRNGYDPRSNTAFSAAAFKAGAASAPFLMTPLVVNATAANQSGAPFKESGSVESAKSSDSGASGVENAANNRWSFGANPFAAAGPPMYPPGIDMSSTQALINMVRTASAQSANQLETYLKGIKRGAENPLDLSATKKVRKSGTGLSLSESLYGDALLGLPMLSALNRASKELLPTTHRLQTKSPKPSKTSQNHTKNNLNSVGHASNNLAPNSSVTISPVTNSSVTNRPQCESLCTDKPCGSGGLTSSANGALSGVSSGINAESAESSSTAEMSSWSVEDVATFVGTIDICAEYAGNFREQRIDGSALPLLTESHLTTALQMKLGPALKLRSVLSRRLGHCAVCMHCVHCHGSQASLGNPQALLGTGPPGPQALLGTGPNPQALLSTTQPASSPSPKPLTRPSSTGN